MSRSPLRVLLVALLVGALTGATLGALAGQASAEPAVTAGEKGRKVISRKVVFTLTNGNQSDTLCLSDGEDHEVRGRLVGPRKEVLGRAGSTRINVLVHGAGTGGWLWNRTGPKRSDYAARLAERGETSLVLDRLGYDASPLEDGRATCLGSQATMLHQVVQNLKAGIYEFDDDSGKDVPHAGQTVVHGHGLGAAIAQLEASAFDDVDGLVLMSWSDTNASQTAVAEVARQTTTCLSSATYAAFGQTAQDFRSLLFSSAPGHVQRKAARKRNDVPCGDVTSVTSALGSLTLGTGSIEPPVLLLFGADDALNREGAAEAQAGRFRSSEGVTTKVFAGTGSALPLEKKAPRVRTQVLRWLDATLVER